MLRVNTYVFQLSKLKSKVKYLIDEKIGLLQWSKNSQFMLLLTNVNNLLFGIDKYPMFLLAHDGQAVYWLLVLVSPLQLINGVPQKQDRQDIMYFHTPEPWFECVMEVRLVYCVSALSRMTLFFLFCLAFFTFGFEALFSTKDIITHMDN